MAETSENDSLKFSLFTDGIEIKALTRILQDTHLCMKEIALSQPFPDGTDTELKVHPFKKGSFEYVLAMGVGALAAGTAVFGTFKAILEYKKAKLDYERSKNAPAARPPEAIQVNPTINLHFNGMMKVISTNSRGFKVVYSDQQTYELTSEQIKKIIEIEKREVNKKKPRRRTIRKLDQQLSLVKTSSTKYGMWEFIYDDMKIMALVPDDLKRVSRFSAYTSGHKMLVDLKIRQEFNVLAQAWENIGYRVSHIHNISKNPQQRIKPDKT